MMDLVRILLNRARGELGLVPSLWMLIRWRGLGYVVLLLLCMLVLSRGSISEYRQINGGRQRQWRERRYSMVECNLGLLVIR